jgi:hypothetical protein
MDPISMDPHAAEFYGKPKNSSMDPISMDPHAAEFYGKPKNSDGQLGFNYDPSQFPSLSSSDK